MATSTATTTNQPTIVTSGLETSVVDVVGEDSEVTTSETETITTTTTLSETATATSTTQSADVEGVGVGVATNPDYR